jgi:hypothetical protein
MKKKLLEIYADLRMLVGIYISIARKMRSEARLNASELEVLVLTFVAGAYDTLLVCDLVPLVRCMQAFQAARAAAPPWESFTDTIAATFWTGTAAIPFLVIFLVLFVGGGVAMLFEDSRQRLSEFSSRTIGITLAVPGTIGVVLALLGQALRAI